MPCLNGSALGLGDWNPAEHVASDEPVSQKPTASISTGLDGVVVVMDRALVRRAVKAKKVLVEIGVEGNDRQILELNVEGLKPEFLAKIK